MFTNRRKAFRCAVAEPEAPALLRLTAGEAVVQVLNQSSEGFGVESRQPLLAHEGELAGLTTRSGQSICRVVRVSTDEQGHTQIGLQRVSDVQTDIESMANPGILARWRGKGVVAAALMVMFGLGLGCAIGLFRFSGLGDVAVLKPNTGRHLLPENGQRLNALRHNFEKISQLSSRQFVRQLGLSTGQQRKVGKIVDGLLEQLAAVHLKQSQRTPEAGAHQGLMMIRHAWVEVEGLLTPEQMQRWDSLLEGDMSAPLSDQVKL